jgi:hypothetical protein
MWWRQADLWAGPDLASLNRGQAIKDRWAEGKQVVPEVKCQSKAGRQNPATERNPTQMANPNKFW